jgi:hypothetical protein
MSDALVKIIIEGVDKASETLKNIGDTGSQVGDTLTKYWKEIALGAAAAGVGLEALARSQQQMTADTRILASELGFTEKQMRDLVLASADYTMSVKETVDVMDTGYKAGLRSQEQLAAYARTWNDVGTATGENSAELAKASIKLQAVGIDAERVGDAQSAFGFITEHTTLSLVDFMNEVGRLAPELNETSVSIDDMAAYLGILESRGITGRASISTFREALNNAGGDVTTLRKELNITSEEFNNYSQKVRDSSDVISDHARIVEGTYTPLQKLQSWVSEVTYSFGGMIQSASIFAPALMAIAPAVTIYAQLSPLITEAGGAVSFLSGGFAGLIPTIGGTLAALAPFLPLIAGIALAAAALYFAWQTNFLGIRDIAGNVADWVTDRWDGVKTSFGKIGDALAPAVGKLQEAFGNLFDKLNDLFMKISGGIPIGEALGKMFDALGRIIDFLISNFIDGLIFYLDLIVQGITVVVDAVSALIDWFTKLADNPVVKFFIDMLGGAIDYVGKKFDEILPPVENTDEALNKLGDTADRTSKVQTAAMASVSASYSGMGLKSKDAATASSAAWSVMGEAATNGTGLTVDMMQTLIKKFEDLGYTHDQAKQMAITAWDDMSSKAIADGEKIGAAATDAADTVTGTEPTYDQFGNVVTTGFDKAATGAEAGAARIKGAIASAIEDYAKAAQLQQANYAELGTTDISGLHAAVASGSLSEYETMNALWQIQRVGGNLSPTEQKLYSALQAKNEASVSAGTGGLLTTGSIGMGAVGTGILSTTGGSMGGGAGSQYSEAPSDYPGYDSTSHITVNGRQIKVYWTGMTAHIWNASTGKWESLTNEDIMALSVGGSSGTGAGTAGETKIWTEPTTSTATTGYTGIAPNTTLTSEYTNAIVMVYGDVDVTGKQVLRGNVQPTHVKKVGDQWYWINLEGEKVAVAPSGWNGSIPVFQWFTTGIGEYTNYVEGTLGKDVQPWAPPGLAMGGTVTDSGFVVVGEGNRPELVNLPKGASVTPLSEGKDDLIRKIAEAVSQRLGSLQGGSDVHFYGPVIADKSGLMWLARELQSIKPVEDARRGLTG